MKSTKHGKNTSAANAVEVSHISVHGFWILAGQREYFVDFDHNPWFKNATVRQILDVRLQHGHHLHWPDLDVDLELESLVEPGKYPLIYK
jgi:hypothetical protein